MRTIKFIIAASALTAAASLGAVPVVKSFFATSVGTAQFLSWEYESTLGNMDWGNAQDEPPSDEPLATIENPPTDSDVVFCRPYAVSGTAWHNSKFLDLTQMSFDPPIPNGASIGNVQVKVRKFRTTEGYAGEYIKDRRVQLIVNGAGIGSNRAILTDDWPTTPTMFTYDGFGASLSGTTVNNSTFGVRLQLTTNASWVEPPQRYPLDYNRGCLDYVAIEVQWSGSDAEQHISRSRLK